MYQLLLVGRRKVNYESATNGIRSFSAPSRLLDTEAWRVVSGIRRRFSVSFNKALASVRSSWRCGQAARCIHATATQWDSWAFPKPWGRLGATRVACELRVSELLFRIRGLFCFAAGFECQVVHPKAYADFLQEIIWWYAAGEDPNVIVGDFLC
jgi:hypothetical protein